MDVCYCIPLHRVTEYPSSLLSNTGCRLRNSNGFEPLLVGEF